MTDNDHDLTEFMLRIFAGLFVLLLAGLLSLFTCFVCTISVSPVQKSEPPCQCCCDPSLDRSGP